MGRDGEKPMISIQGVNKHFGDLHVLKDINLEVARGQVIGTVGGEGTPEGAHVEFQIRTPGGEAVDPLTWLRGR